MQSAYEHYIGKNTFHLIGLRKRGLIVLPKSCRRRLEGLPAAQAIPRADACVRNTCGSRQCIAHRDTMSFIVDGSQDAIWQLVINARTANSILGPYPCAGAAGGIRSKLGMSFDVTSHIGRSFA